MASAKDTFEAGAFGATSFACGAWRGTGPQIYGWIEYAATGRSHYHAGDDKAHYSSPQGRARYDAGDDKAHYKASGRTHYRVPPEDT